MDKQYIRNNSDEELARQLTYIDKTKNIIMKFEKEKGRALTCHVVTFGCQMNARDSEKLAGVLEAVGYQLTEKEEADLVIFNTCTVRDNANQRVYGRLGALSHAKKKNKDMKIALCGCMMQESTAVEKIQKSYSFVDLIFGTHNLFKFPELLYSMFINDRMTIDIWDKTDEIVENLPIERKYAFKSGINIMFGCNNFCSYCIVPYVRGRERSRNSKEIIKEIEDLAEDGVTEVMLLGQNVNSYGKNIEGELSFPKLLQEIEKIDKIKRIRFMTSHPKDLSDELIEVMKTSTKICRHIHLPLQSGSDAILKRMNRRYTKESYLNLVNKIRSEIPDISITTDIIVGFPGETKKDIDETIDVIKKAEFENAFTFIYSKRTGTPAASMEDQVSEEFIKTQFDRVLDTVQTTAKSRVGNLKGRTMEVLVEEINDHDSSYVTGRLSNNIMVHFKGDASLIGQFVKVKLLEAKGFYYFGEKA